MRKTLLVAVLSAFAVSGVSRAGDMSPGTASVVSTGVISAGSSVLVSGIILSPIVLPVSLVMLSVEKAGKQKTAVLTAKDPDNKTVKMQVPLKVAEDANLKAGDKITLEKAPEGTGAYLKKDGKVLSHMVNQQESGLSTNQPVPSK